MDSVERNATSSGLSVPIIVIDASGLPDEITLCSDVCDDMI